MFPKCFRNVLTSFPKCSHNISLTAKTPGRTSQQTCAQHNNIIFLPFLVPKPETRNPKPETSSQIKHSRKILISISRDPFFGYTFSCVCFPAKPETRNPKPKPRNTHTFEEKNNKILRNINEEDSEQTRTRNPKLLEIKEEDSRGPFFLYSTLVVLHAA